MAEMHYIYSLADGNALKARKLYSERYLFPTGAYLAQEYSHKSINVCERRTY